MKTNAALPTRHRRASNARQQAETALRESERKFRGLFLNSRDAMNTADPATKRFTSCNPATLQMFGVKTEAEFIAHSPASFSPERQPDGRLSVDAVKSMIEITLREGAHFFEWTHRRANGEEFPTDVLLTRVEQDGKHLILATIRDITERKRAEAALRASEEKLRQIFEHSVQVFYAHTADGQLTYVSPQAEKYFDCPVAEALQHWTEFLTDNPLNLEGIELTRRAIESGEQQRPYQLELKSKRGRTFWVEVHESPVVVAGKAVGIVGALTDITGRKQSEAALKQLHGQLVEASRQAGMAEVATSVLHNIGNVLNSVNIASACVADGLRKSKSANLAKVAALLAGHADDLGAFFTSDPKGRQLPGYLAQLAEHLAGERDAALKELADLQKNIEHIKNIVNMQQSFAKTSGLAETLPLADLVEDALKMNAGLLTGPDIQIIREFAALPPVTVEKHKVLQILVNLVRNARQACDELDPPQKRLTLRVAGAGGRIQVSVTDNGIGIPPENLARIFAHGFTTKKTGHGFGLHGGALAAQALGGSLTVHSDGPGRGATFTLELPCVPTKDSHE